MGVKREFNEKWPLKIIQGRISCSYWKADEGLHSPYNNIGSIGSDSEDITSERTEHRGY